MTLHEAAMNDNILEVKNLLTSKKTKVNSYEDYICTPIMFAIGNRNTDMVELLLQHGADPDLQDLSNGETFERGEVDSTIIAGWTPLNSACLHGVGYSNIIELLLKYNANVNLQNDFNDTPLMNAALYSSPDTVKLLLEHKAQVNLQNNGGWTALMNICQRGTGYLKVAQHLIDYNSNINLQNDNGDTALILASEWNHPNIVKLLLQKNANKSLKNKDGETALSLAKKNNHKNIINLLER